MATTTPSSSSTRSSGWSIPRSASAKNSSAGAARWQAGGQWGGLGHAATVSPAPARRNAWDRTVKSLRDRARLLERGEVLPGRSRASSRTSSVCWPQSGRGRQRRASSRRTAPGSRPSVNVVPSPRSTSRQVAVGERLRIVAAPRARVCIGAHTPSTVVERLAPLGERARREHRRRARATHSCRFWKRAMPLSKRGSVIRSARSSAGRSRPRSGRAAACSGRASARPWSVAVDDRVRRLACAAKAGISWSVSFASTMSGARIHIAVPSSETSTTDGSPVRSRRNSAAAMPPAIVMPPAESPKAARCMMGARRPAA